MSLFAPNKPKVVVVVPVHIPLSEKWVASLIHETQSGEFKADVFIVDDSDGKVALPSAWHRFDYTYQESYLGKDYEFFAEHFHKQSACRNFGHLIAYKDGYDVIIGLDSDCIVPKNFISKHLAMLGATGWGWTNPLQHQPKPWYPRGYAYSQRNWPIAANMGVWEHVLDLNGRDRHSTEPTEVAPSEVFDINGIASAPIPFSGMNFAIEKEALPAFCFLPNFDVGPHQFRRIDDIWGGVIFQAIMKRLHKSVSYGEPVVWHDTIVDPKEDADAEAAMYKYEDDFIGLVDLIDQKTRLINPLMDEVQAMKVFFAQLAAMTKRSFFKPLSPSFEWWMNQF